MTKVELFIKEKGINLSKMERELELPQKSLRIDRGLPKKYYAVILEYLIKNHGYEDVNSIEEVDIPIGKAENIIQRKWNKNFIPKWKDGIARYQEPENGLWKRLMQWQSYIDQKTGEVVLNKKFFPLGKEVFEDKIGKYNLAVNGIKVYTFAKVK